MEYDLLVIGGGAAGFFGAINAALANPTLRIVILEQSKEVLNKVRISGGGRCNLTHACYDPKTLVTYYPRGHRELVGPFNRFGPEDTIQWFANHDVPTKVEEDGRIFPLSNSSDSIINCFTKLCADLGIEVLTNHKVTALDIVEEGYRLTTSHKVVEGKQLLITAGSSPNLWQILANHGYQITSAVPSLFTFNLPKNDICALMGLSVPHAIVTIPKTTIKTEGPLLITHWGLSGPAILKASAWGARSLAELQYDTAFTVDWIPKYGDTDIQDLKTSIAKKNIRSNTQFGLPGRLWQFMIDTANIPPSKVWADISKVELNELITLLKRSPFHMKGKTTFKEEFVTAGGVNLSQINFKTFESKLHPGLFMAGEVLDIDGVTGGFNFQAAWTGSYLAAAKIAEQW